MSTLPIDDLAIFTGKPAFDEQMHVGKPNIGDPQRVLKRIAEILQSGRLSNFGPMVHEFEREIAGLLGVAHCVAVCNGTVALEVAIRALGLVGEVIVPSYTFIATAHALQWQRITPVFCDIDPQTHHIDPVQVERLITPRTSGILGVHLWGSPCNIDSLSNIARRHHLRLLFDAAHAFGVSYRGKMIGSFGAAEVLSFHATKFLNSFEGGAVVTNDNALAKRLRLMVNFGFPGGKYDAVVHIGTNGKMHEASAAMGLSSLECMGEFVEANYRNYKTYLSELQSLRGLSVRQWDERETNNYQYIVVELDEEQIGISRDLVVDILHAENVLVRRYFWPGCHRMEPYRSLYPDVGQHLPHTEQVSKQVLVLPTGVSVSAADIRKICDILRRIVGHGPQILKELPPQSANVVGFSQPSRGSGALGSDGTSRVEV